MLAVHLFVQPPTCLVLVTLELLTSHAHSVLCALMDPGQRNVDLTPFLTYCAPNAGLSFVLFTLLEGKHNLLIPTNALIGVLVACL